VRSEPKIKDSYNLFSIQMSQQNVNLFICRLSEMGSFFLVWGILLELICKSIVIHNRILKIL
jgi:hypothetical protein